MILRYNRVKRMLIVKGRTTGEGGGGDSSQHHGQSGQTHDGGRKVKRETGESPAFVLSTTVTLR